MKIFICIYELETKNLQLSLASLQIKVHDCKVDLRYFSSWTRYNLHSSLTKMFLLNDFFQQEMLFSQRHKNTYNKLTETGNFWGALSQRHKNTYNKLTETRNFWGAQFLKHFFANQKFPWMVKKFNPNVIQKRECRKRRSVHFWMTQD